VPAILFVLGSGIWWATTDSDDHYVYAIAL
jgi:hypothetical protein